MIIVVRMAAVSCCSRYSMALQAAGARATDLSQLMSIPDVIAIGMDVWEDGPLLSTLTGVQHKI